MSWGGSEGSGDAPHRAGFVSLIGRPNVGKSTLLNRLLGQKLAIVSPKPQTTRHRIRGIRTRPGSQVIYVDTPGLHPGGGKLGRLMAETAAQALEDVDAVVLVEEATAPPQLDAGVLDALRTVSAPVVLALNKIDLVAARMRLLPLLDAYAGRYHFRELVPLSAAAGTGVDRLEAVLSVETARRQAKALGHSLAEELDLLACHACLHLVGYDDRDRREARLMHAREMALLGRLYARPAPTLHVR